MRAIDLNWRTTANTGAKSPRTGDELYTAIFGRWSRFQIAECYQYPRRPGDGERNLYVVRDAHRITDAEVRAGKRPPVVFRDHDAQVCVDWALAIEATENAHAETV